MKNKGICFNWFKLFFFILLFFSSCILFAQKSFAAEVSVSTWAQFKSAYEDQTVTKITLANDITYTGGAIAMTLRTADLEIDGTKPGTIASEYNNYKLDLGYTSMIVGKPTGSTTATFTIKNLTVANYGDIGTGYRGGYIETLEAWAGAEAVQYGKYWNFNVENIYAPDVNYLTGLARLIRCPRSQINVSGNNKLYTRAENYYTGGMNFAENTIYYGEITQANYSIIWFKNQVGASDTGSGDFIVGANSDIKLRNVRDTRNTGYPAIYLYYRNIEIGENSNFTASVPGAAVQFSGDGQSFTAKENSVVTLTSLNNFPSIQDSVTNRSDIGANAPTPIMDWSEFYARNATMSFQNGSSLFVIGKTNSPTTAMVKLNSYPIAANTNNNITLESPKQFDIRNNAVNTNYDAVQIGNTGSSSNSFTINNSNIAIWKTNSSFSKGADYIYDTVANLKITSSNVWTSSTNLLATGLNSIKTTSRSNISRINGLNTIPTVEWQYNITDADKILTKVARISLGEVPDDTGLDANGNLHFIKQYAGTGLPVKISNSADTTIINSETDTNGYISPTLDNFYKADTTFTATATRGKLISEATVSDKVFKITPPVPATVTKGAIYNTDSSIVGSGAEAGATVYVDVNGTRLEETATVAEDGSYSYPLKNKLAVGDKVTIYLQDHVGVAPTKLKVLPAPTTNSSVGNINPSSSLAYSDATFPAATTYTVEKGNSILTIQFEDEAGTVLSGYTLTAGEAATNSIATPVYVGDTIDLTSATFKKVQDQLTALQTAGYEIVSRPTNETALPVTETEQTITYKLKGLLFLQSAPATIDFGSITYNAKTQRVDNPTADKNLVITDTRASKANGWTLYATLSSDLKNSTTGSVMSDALRYVKTDGNEIILNSGNQAIYQNTTGGTTNVTEGWGTSATTAGLKLVADPTKTTISSIGSYSGVVTWTIMAGQP